MTYATITAPCARCKTEPQFSRTLCQNCYQNVRRNKELDDWPTAKFIENPEAHIRWAFQHKPELLADIAIEFKYMLTRRE